MHASAKEIESNPDVLYAEPDVILHPFAVPTDPRNNEQWHYFEAVGGINLPATRDVASGEGMIAGVIDSGIRYHDDLIGQDDHYYADFQGASMAAPHVAGVVALLLSANPELTPDRIRNILVSTVRPFPTEAGRPCDPERCGAGIIDAAGAVARAGSGHLIDVPKAEDTFENTSDVEIADADYTGASSVIDVNRAEDVSTIQVTLNIRQPNASELYAVLVSPDGEHVVLEGFTAQGADFRKTCRIDATGIPAEGACTLTVVDDMPGNAAYIDGWKMRIVQSADVAASNAGQKTVRRSEPR